LKANDEINILGLSYVNCCYGITKELNGNDYMLVFEYAKNRDLHNHLSKKLPGGIK